VTLVVLPVVIFFISVTLRIVAALVRLSLNKHLRRSLVVRASLRVLVARSIGLLALLTVPVLLFLASTARHLFWSCWLRFLRIFA
jgi:hypothetical protein